jgi:D-alanine-D-alanine ligase
MQRPLIAVFRGGYSGESVISHQSAQRMLGAVDTTRFEPVYITITPESWSSESPDGGALPFDRALLRVDTGAGLRPVSAALIAIHGAPGEDGKLQGLLDMLGVPYQTGGVLNMAVTFSKFSTTTMLRQMGFPVAASLLFSKANAPSDDRILAQVGLPCFVKPDQSGSSLGISKVKTAADLRPALDKAFAEGETVMVEAFLKGRELTCGVIRHQGRALALPVCEVRHSHEFFDYEAKYHATDTQELIPAPLTDAVTHLVQQRSEAIYTALGCRGMVRVDHMWTGEDPASDEGDLFTIEVNTTPGFSPASIVPKMLEVCGIGVAPAVNGLIEECLHR